MEQKKVDIKVETSIVKDTKFKTQYIALILI